MRILVVEDDPDMFHFIARGLRAHSYAVDVATTGEEAIERVSDSPYDAVLLDAMIPQPDGFALCRRFRAEGMDFAILMLTARDALSDRVEGLDAGADDYLIKPFHFPELLARLRALLRRRGTRQFPVIGVADLSIDTRSHRATRGERTLILTAKEYALLEFLATHAGRVLGREEISEHVWDGDFDVFSKLIEVYISRLRRIVDQESDAKLIHTIRGAGYVLGLRDEAEW
jgi:DNA-binding response OmpR family regulator